MSRLKGIGYARTRSNGSSVTATVVLRSGRAVGVVRYSAPKRITRAGTATAARAYATILAARMDRTLSRTAWERAMDGIRDGRFGPARHRAEGVRDRLRLDPGREAARQARRARRPTGRSPLSSSRGAGTT